MLGVEQYFYQPGAKLVPLNRFVFMYKQLYQRGVDLFSEFNPCDVKNGKCMGLTHDFCCAGCEHLSDTGCTTESLWCKLYVCGDIASKFGRPHEDKPHEFWRRLQILKTEYRQLCRGRAGRYDMGQTIRSIYGHKEYEEWKTTQTSINSTCGQSAS